MKTWLMPLNGKDFSHLMQQLTFEDRTDRVVRNAMSQPKPQTVGKPKNQEMLFGSCWKLEDSVVVTSLVRQQKNTKTFRCSR